MNNKEYIKGRGAQIQLNNRFSNAHYEELEDYFEEDTNPLKSKFLKVYPKTVVNKVNSPDLGFMLSLNPYQGCEHGCVYCYARNSHEYWGYNAGLDFESVILVKEDAPEIVEKKISHSNWKPFPIMLSGNTDCYQPVEQKLGITRKILQVFKKYRHPVGIITKNALILRDIDILADLAQEDLVHVSISLTGMDETIRKKMEPRTSTYEKRLKTIETLSNKGIPVNVMIAPIIPAINSDQIISVAKAASNAGALSMGYTIIRLNGKIGEIFVDWLIKNFPDRADKVIHQIETLHGGQLKDSRFGVRMKGEGKFAEIIKQQIDIARKLYFSGRKMPDYNLSVFKKQQLTLF